jgi:protein tyrosine/serine phosphatase
VEKVAFAALGIRTVIDLRRPHEIAELGRIPEIAGVTYHHVHMAHPLWPFTEAQTRAERVPYLIERYRDMSIEAGDGIGQALRLVADPGNAPLVFHCIAGKDRTGVISALVLSLLGVPDDVVAEDYGLSEEAEPPARAYWLARNSRSDSATYRRSEVVSPPEAMLGFLDDLRERHGTVEGYAKSVGVSEDDLASMRAHLLTR